MSMNDVVINAYNSSNPHFAPLEKFSTGVKTAINNSPANFVVYGHDGRLRNLNGESRFIIVYKEFMQYDFATVHKPELVDFMNHTFWEDGKIAFWLTDDGILHAGACTQTNYRSTVNDYARRNHISKYYDRDNQVWMYRNNA